MGLSILRTLTVIITRLFHGACLQEMIALASIMVPSDDGDPLKYFARAMEQYTKLPGMRARLLASRCTLTAGTVLTCVHSASLNVRTRGAFKALCMRVKVMSKP